MKDINQTATRIKYAKKNIINMFFSLPGTILIVECDT